MASDSISDALHAQVYGLFVIGSVSKDGEPNGMTANWVTQVAFDPRIVAVAIESDAHTRANIDDTGVFSVSILPAVSEELAVKFTRKSTSGEGRLEGEPVSYFETGAPVLDAAVAWYECRVVDSDEPGDHVIYFGEVTGGGMGPAAGEAAPLSAVGMSYAG